MINANSETILNPHDLFFRQAMQDKRVAIDFLKAYLPGDLCSRVDFNRLTLQPRSQINALRKESIVDVLFKTKIDDKEAYLYLLVEHQSSGDPLMSFRVLEYTVNAIREHLKTHQSKTIPLVYPLVVYHGKPYKFVTNINELVDGPAELVDKYFLKPFQLIDLNQISDNLLQKTLWSGVMTLTLKHIFERDMLPFLKGILSLLKKAEDAQGQDFIGIVLQYTRA